MGQYTSQLKAVAAKPFRGPSQPRNPAEPAEPMMFEKQAEHDTAIKERVRDYLTQPATFELDLALWEGTTVLADAIAMCLISTERAGQMLLKAAQEHARKMADQEFADGDNPYFTYGAD